jgi:hypothetical protein
MISWVVTVSIKFAIAIPLNQPFLHVLVLSVPSWLASLLYNSYIGLLTGVTECGLLFLAVQCTSLKTYGFNQIIAFGIGFGAIESALLGVRYGLGILFAESSQLALLSVGYLSVVERASTLLGHTLACALIFYSIIGHHSYLFWISFAGKAAVDGLASWFALTHPTATRTDEIGLYMMFALLAAVSWMGLRWLNRRRGEWSADVTAGGVIRNLAHTRS